MKSEKILVIGMLDSIHLARWLLQFVGDDFEITVFASTHFRYPHERLANFSHSNVRILGLKRFGKFLGFFDSIITFRFFGSTVGKFFREFYLKLYIHAYRPRVIHAIEIQHAGYLVSSVNASAKRKILTNWGSDIYYFRHIPSHETKIRLALNWATHYSAECSRDYKLAEDLGFSGVELPKIPNAGGFMVGQIDRYSLGERSQLIVKSYGGQFGLGLIAVSVCTNFLEHFKFASVFLYSVTDDLLMEVENLSYRFPGRVRYVTQSDHLNHEEILEEFSKSRVYLGLSRSDGLSTSFLEALISGAYPIQSNTSCASEFIDVGAIGSIVEPNVEDVTAELFRVYADQHLIDHAHEKNKLVAEQFLAFGEIKEIAKSYYL
jgi:hypothetical protein